MNATDVIREVQENAAEWLEMVENPAELTAGILANKIVGLKSYIEYLEKRLDVYDRSSTSFGRHPTRN
jgi:hypothetical protein